MSEKELKEQEIEQPVEEATKENEAASTEEKVEEKVEETQEQILEKKLAESNDRYIRLAAEFDNFRRRSAKERLELISTASEEVIKGLLPTLDDCERALDALKSSENSEEAKQGTELIYNKLLTYLKSSGLEKIEAVGKDLDTDFHEAIAKFPVKEKKKKGKIIDVVQQGYTLRGKVIRFAKVVVGE